MALLAGFLSFLSPCVLPLVPAYVSYITGSTMAELNSGHGKLSVLYKSIGFTLGFSIVFIIMGISVSSIGKLFVNNHILFRKIGGALIIIFGLHTMGILKVRSFYKERRMFPIEKAGEKFGPIFMGMAFATGWTPCIGPILSSILIYAGSMDTISKGIILLVAYSLGLAVPFILTALVIGYFAKNIRKITKYMNIISIISGLLMILMGVLVFTNKINILSRYLYFINF